jgi:hypothetical protein
MFGSSLSDGGGLSGWFSRRKKRATSKSASKRKRKSLGDGTDAVQINIYTDDIKTGGTAAKAAPRKRRKAKPKAKPAAPKRRRKPTAAKPTASKPKRRRKPTAAKPAPKPAPKPRKRKPAAAPKRKTVPATLQKRRARRTRKRDTEQRVEIEAFGSTKARMGISDDEPEAAMQEIETMPETDTDSDTLMDCTYTDPSDALIPGALSANADMNGLEDREPTDTEAKKINRINEHLREFEKDLGVKYRAAFSSRSPDGYVMRKFVAASDKLETWGDPYISRRPVGIGGKTLESVFMNKHGFSYYLLEGNLKRGEISDKIQKHLKDTTSAQRAKAESAAIKERQKEEREEVKKAASEAKKLKHAAIAKAKLAKMQEVKAEKAEKTAKVATAKAKKQPTATNKAAAKRATKKAVMEEKKIEVIEQQIERLEAKAEKAEEKAEQQTKAAAENDPRLAILEKLAAKYA